MCVLCKPGLTETTTKINHLNRYQFTCKNIVFFKYDFSQRPKTLSHNKVYEINEYNIYES